MDNIQDVTYYKDDKIVKTTIRLSVNNIKKLNKIKKLKRLSYNYIINKILDNIKI